jgi:uncharacterized protein (UPF0248 family)
LELIGCADAEEVPYHIIIYIEKQAGKVIVMAIWACELFEVS